MMTLLPALASASVSRTELQDRTEKGAIKYFVENSHPATGLTLDRALNYRPSADSSTEWNWIPASIASTGFSLAVRANAAERGLVDRKETYDYLVKTLRFSRDHAARWKGWFAHFIDWQTGQRMWGSEYSSIDTALFLGGALYAAQVFPNTEVAEITHQLYADTDFDALRTDDGKAPKKLTISMGYLPESGFIPAQWDMYAEQTILLILGLGHPKHPLPASSWLVFNRQLQNGLMGYDQALFVHQYSQLFLDLRNFTDSFGSYFDNSVKASLAQREMAKADQQSATFRNGFWGFSAGLAPDERYEVATAVHHGTTVCIGCAQASAMFIPNEVFSDLASWTEGPHGTEIWGRYGLTDSLDLDKKWIAQSVFGITVGPAYMSFANLDAKTSIWRLFSQIPEIKKGLEVAANADRENRPPDGDRPPALIPPDAVPPRTLWMAEKAPVKP